MQIMSLELRTSNGSNFRRSTRTPLLSEVDQKRGHRPAYHAVNDRNSITERESSNFHHE